MKFSKYLFFITSWVLLFLSGCVLESHLPTKWNTAKVNHTFVTGPFLEFLWQRPIYTATDMFGCPCGAINHILFVIGSETPEGDLQMIAINSEDGKTIWTKETGIRFAYSQDQLFLGDGQIVTSLSIGNGEKMWEIHLPQSHNIGNLYYFDGKLFVSDSGYPFFVVSPEDGEIIEKYSSVDGFRHDYPTVPFYPDMNFNALVVEEDIILNEGDIVYSIIRGKPNTHKSLWEIENDSISNSTIIGDSLFYISKDDWLKAVNINSGELLFKVQIQPSFEFFNLERDAQHDGYYLCSDETNRNLYVILGDSRQLFAFWLPNG